MSEKWTNRVGGEELRHECMYHTFENYLKKKGIPKEQMVELLGEIDFSSSLQNRIFHMMNFGGEEIKEMPEEVLNYINKIIN